MIISAQCELKAGWDRRTGMPCWSIEDVGTMEVALPSVAGGVLDSGGDVVLEFQARAYVPERSHGRRFSILIDGAPVHRSVFYSKRLATVRVTLPTAALHRGRTHIEFFLEPAGSPASNGESDDVRELGVHLEQVGIHPAQGAGVARRHLVEAGYGLARELWAEPLHEDAWANAGDLETLLTGALREGRPFSFVRAGDGEGRLLGYPTWFSDLDILHEVVRYQYGQAAVAAIYEKHPSEPYDRRFEKGVVVLKELVSAALERADAVGLPTPVHIQHAERTEGASGRAGFASALLHGARYMHGPAKRPAFDTFIFKGFARRGGFARLLKGLDFVGTVNHHDVGPRLRDVFGVQATSFVRIPGHHSFETERHSAPHYPSRYEDVLKQLRVPYAGALFLVGGGYLGKVYCDAIKMRGGIALDIGSVFDGWSGVGRPDMKDDQNFRL